MFFLSLIPLPKRLISIWLELISLVLIQAFLMTYESRNCHVDEPLQLFKRINASDTLQKHLIEWPSIAVYKGNLVISFNHLDAICLTSRSLIATSLHQPPQTEQSVSNR